VEEEAKEVLISPLVALEDTVKLLGQPFQVEL
jgi:hypothetical protein